MRFCQGVDLVQLCKVDFKLLLVPLHLCWLLSLCGFLLVQSTNKTSIIYKSQDITYNSDPFDISHQMPWIKLQRIWIYCIFYFWKKKGTTRNMNRHRLEGTDLKLCHQAKKALRSASPSWPQHQPPTPVTEQLNRAALQGKCAKDSDKAWFNAQ